METKTKKTTEKKRISTKYGGIVCEDMVSYENDPFFLKKAESAKAFLAKAGVPATFKKNK